MGGGLEKQMTSKSMQPFKKQSVVDMKEEFGQ